MTNPILVALDTSDSDAALALAEKLAPVVGGFKIGSELFTSAGPDIVRSIREMDKDVFLDLKFHDIPNTVAHAVAAATRLDIQMLTVHTSGGHTMLEAAVTASKEEAAALGITPPLVLGVTILTSLGSDDMQKIGMDANVSRQVHRLSRLAADSGIHGLVCSPLEVAKLRQEMPEYFTLVTPGIRRSEDTRSDQKRTLSAPDAIEAGADRLVIGRPICAAPDPRKAAEEILRSITA